MRLRPSHALHAVLLASLLATGCGQGLPSRPAGLGAARLSPDAQAASASAFLAAQGELNAQTGPDAPALAIGESGLSANEFIQADRDGDGRLSASEQAAVFKSVWDGMMAIAADKADDAELSAQGGAYDPRTYQVAHPLTLAPTNAEVFVDAGEILPAVYQAMQGAQKSIWMDVFLLGGAAGQKLAELLVAKKAAGVDVRIIHDPGWGLSGATKDQVVSVMRYLQRQGIPIKAYPLGYLQHRTGVPGLANKFQIDHNKFIVVDEQTAMIGSMNLIDIGTMNHDVYLRLDGAPALELAAIHKATWGLKGPKTPDFRTPTKEEQPKPRMLLSLGDPAPAMARVVKTDIDVQSTKKVLIENIKNAKKSVHIAIYEFGDMDVADALAEAYKRGVDVKVLADKNSHYAKYVDAFKYVKLYGTPNLRTMNRLREAGVPVKWYVPQTEDQEIHMKVGLFDGERAILGSTNFTYQAFRTFRETSMDIVGGSVAPRLESTFQKDWDGHSVPVVKPNFKEKAIATAVKYMDLFNLSWW